MPSLTQPNSAAQAIPMTDSPPCSLYVHLPWCVKKCPYCDFNSHQPAGAIPEQEYLYCLLKDLQQEVDYFRRARPIPPLNSLFFGGGTPSLLSPHVFACVIKRAQTLVGFKTEIEITLEANPGTVDKQKLTALREAGINRLSIGAQSFSYEQLNKLGRIHDLQDTFSVFHGARETGFDNVNLDLMFGLPGQSINQALSDLDAAIKLAPEHISWYQLTIEPNTHFYRSPPQLPEDDLIGDMHQAGIQRLQQAGYYQYEVSAFARTGKRSLHNLNYWRYGDYLAVGAGAHGKCTRSDNGQITRHWKTRQPEHYLKRIDHCRAGSEQITPDQLPFDFLMNALRLKDGVAESAYTDATGLTLQTLEPQLSRFRKQGLIMPERLACTETGYHHLNTLLSEFISEAD